MSSEKTVKVFLNVGNTHIRQRGSGYSVVSCKSCASRHRTGKNDMDIRNEVTGKLYCHWVYVSWHLNLRLYRKACIQKMTKSRDQNRIREIRPSGIAGRLAET